MEIQTTSLPGVLLIEPALHQDDRGFFLETWHRERYVAAGIPGPFVQDNHSHSKGGTLRGLHLQLRRPQGKLVWVALGEIFDVAVDLRPDSSSFGAFVSATLNAANHRQMYIPPGFAHGFCVLSETADVEYKCTDFYDPGGELSVLWNDPEIGIPWPVKEPSLSSKDQNACSLDEMRRLLA